MRSVALAAAFGAGLTLACTKFAALDDTPDPAMGSIAAVAEPPRPERVDPLPAVVPVRGSESGVLNPSLSPPVRDDTARDRSDAGLTRADTGGDPVVPDAAPPAPPPVLPVPEAENDPPGTVRFVRLVADSEVLARPFAALGELDLLGPGGASLDHSLWIASADSAEPTYLGGAPAQAAIDGDIDTLWHTAWFELDDPPGYPHELRIDLGRAERLGAFRYVPRQPLSVGRISTYRFYVSRDGLEWGNPVAAGVFPNSADEQIVPLVIE